MIIEENENANYLEHWGILGQKKGRRRFQSYAVAPTRSGMVGEEVGEAAQQRIRLSRSSELMPDRKRIRKEAEKNYRERLKAEKKATDEAEQKKEWAKSYKTLEKHAESFSNQELKDALYRLDLMDKIKSRRISNAEDVTQKGANTLKNISTGATAVLGIYNALAAGVNAYNSYNNPAAKKLPKAGFSNNQQQQKKPQNQNK